MAKLECIYISGIRSYGIEKDDAQTLQFYSPVSLFLGQNGCGKTTIIECVKHALTGDFPFGSKSGGQTFVADPTLYRQHSVKGCIKLKFCDIYGNPATISRTLKLEALSADKFKCQAQDASYKYYDRNLKPHELSVKLADCKNMIRMLVGVSEPVLSNVLFCHQEDSMWPLAEDLAVKKKFDQIFDSSVFDQSVDFLTKMIKNRTVILKNSKNELTLLKDMKKTAKRKRATLKDKEESLNMLNKEIKDKKERYAPLKNKYNEVLALEASLSHLQKLKSEQENQLKSNRDYQKDLKGILKSVFEGSDEALDNEIKNFHERCRQKKDELQRIEEQIRSKQVQFTANNDKIQNSISNLAALKEQMNVYDQRVAERDENAVKLIKTYNGLPKNNFEENLADIKILLLKEKETLGQNEIELQKYEDEVQTEVEGASKTWLEAQNHATLKAKENEAALDEKRNLDNQLANLAECESAFKNFENQMKTLQDEIDSIQSSIKQSNPTKAIETNKKKIYELKENLKELDSHMELLSRNELIDKEIEHYQTDNANKEKDIRNMRTKLHSELKALFPGGITMENLRKEVDKISLKNTGLLKAKRRDLLEKEKVSSNLNAKLSVYKNEFATVKRELQNGRKAIEKFTNADEFDSKILAVEEKNNVLQKKKGQLSAFKIIYKDFVKDLSEKKCCPVCETDFSAKREKVMSLAKSMNEKIQNVPEHLNEVTLQLEEGVKLFNELTQLKPVHAKMTKLESELKAKETLVVTTETEYNNIKTALKNLISEIDQHQNILEICSKLQPGAVLIDQHVGDIAKGTEKIQSLKGKLEEVSSKLTKAETKIKISDAKDEITALDSAIDRIDKRFKTNQNRVHGCRMEMSELTNARLDLQRLVLDKPNLMRRRLELEKKLTEFDDVIVVANSDVLVAKANVESAKEKLAGLKRTNVNTLYDLRKKFQEHEGLLNDIIKLQKEVVVMENKKFNDKCLEVNEMVKQLQKKRVEIENESMILNKKRELLKEEQHDSDSADKSLQNNKKLRDLMKNEVKIQKTIEAFVADIGNKNYDSIDTEKISLQRQLSEITTYVANIEGQLTSLNANIEDLKKELKNCKTDPIKSYNERVISIKTEQVVIDTLKITLKKISDGISKYHREQLLLLNLRLRDLWRSIYKGNDIEYIQIKSGETVTTGVNRRVFSYYIEQKKGDVLMPMRGKCSAGQKVLACLLVRIVLAEHFSADCGIFALDEPTTNLDRENIRSLSQAVARLISSHKDRSNFQFLIITHDEEFLDALREVDAVKDFYRVKRNYKGNTVVHKESI